MTGAAITAATAIANRCFLWIIMPCLLWNWMFCLIERERTRKTPRRGDAPGRAAVNTGFRRR
jgi:hypothetical protein